MARGGCIPLGGGFRNARHHVARDLHLFHAQYHYRGSFLPLLCKLSPVSFFFFLKRIEVYFFLFILLLILLFPFFLTMHLMQYEFYINLCRMENWSLIEVFLYFGLVLLIECFKRLGEICIWFKNINFEINILNKNK